MHGQGGSLVGAQRQGGRDGGAHALTGARVRGCASQEEVKRKQQQLKEVRVAFLEEELPALVAKNSSLGERPAAAPAPRPLPVPRLRGAGG